MNKLSGFPAVRMRRLRSHPKLRALVRETSLTVEDLIIPLFIKSGENIRQEITSMPGQYQFSLDQLCQEISSIVKLAIPAIILFGIPEKKDASGAKAYCDDGIIQQAVRQIKQQAPDLLVITDVCFCEYTDHGHCGVVDGEVIDNDATLPLLAEQAVSHAQAGADVVAPSGMMDGMVQAIRSGLDAAGFSNVPILSYAVKYASAFYGPFRDAAEGAPQFGDRSSYQMDISNTGEALREADLDVLEGADMLMVKPAHAYLDVIYRVKERHPHLPMAAYHVSGEYAMIKAAAEKGWLDEERTMMEVTTAIKRAGANIIITYFAKDIARILQASSGS
jgi:porphobilinogen synthase